jgi:hypothetical protein
MKPLTFDNTLRDGISLLSWIKNTKYPAGKDSKVIPISGKFKTTYTYHLPTPKLSNELVETINCLV